MRIVENKLLIIRVKCDSIMDVGRGEKSKFKTRKNRDAKRRKRRFKSFILSCDLYSVNCTIFVRIPFDFRVSIRKFTVYEIRRNAIIGMVCYSNIEFYIIQSEPIEYNTGYISNI